ncbi:kinase-like domain-containing protein [Amanita rubescens]|nr:kinase-like domain-containing protein [Amanita rubescens]
MESTEELQKLEITALRSIYAEDFIDCPPPTVWKGATRLPEFLIKIAHPDSDKVYLHLHTKFPKTYPSLACPIFTIEKPLLGLTIEQVTRLSHAVNGEAQKCRGSEMVFQIVNFVQEWFSENVRPPVEVVGSLAVQMTQRAMDEERARKQREAEDLAREQERVAREAEALQAQIKEDAMRQLLAREEFKARNRAYSESTAVPVAGDTLTETFSVEIEVNGLRFSTVKLFHPRNERLGTVYLAEPVCDDVNTTLPLELLVVAFDTHYYTTSQGRKKIKQVEAEIQRLISVRHQNILSVFAVKLNMPHSAGAPQLVVLSEQAPALTLFDVLEDCESLREERASDYLCQILSALEAVHAGGLMHRGITPRCIGLSSRDQGQGKQIKLGRVGYYTLLLDLHRSNAFGLTKGVNVDDSMTIPEAWRSRDVQNESSLFYTRHRDIHAVGIVLLQMLLGLDVTERFSDVQSALMFSSISPSLAQTARNMIEPPKKNDITCLTLLADLAAASRHNSAPIAIVDPTLKTPRLPPPSGYGTSPDSTDYKMMQAQARPRQASRWKEDWEELELLGKGAFGSVVKAQNKIDNRIYAVKKIRLKTLQKDNKIFREVNALSRLSHRFIVRYYTTWVETSEVALEAESTVASEDEGDEDGGGEDGLTSVPGSSADAPGKKNLTNGHSSGTGDLFLGGGFSINLDDLDEISGSHSKSSFPSIHFSRSMTPESGESSGSESSGTNGSGTNGSGGSGSEPDNLNEFVERQTLKELVDEGISEDEAWRLFQQILDALVHMSTLGILHRDIKLKNIFIDAKGDCKVGDFGLATSSLAAVDPSDVSPYAVVLDADMTLAEVGTRLYIAPEVQSRNRGPRTRNHDKADMYSLGIVFFEMNYKFSTGAERIAVIEGIRRPEPIFPPDWDPQRARQKDIITWLLQHDPSKRPTAAELSQSTLLPPKMEDEYFKGALKLIAKPDSPHLQTVLSSLFNQPPKPSRGFLYDYEADVPEHVTLNDIVNERLSAIFRLHGAVDMEPPLLMPITDPEDIKNHSAVLDSHGDVVMLPNNILVPFARLAARANTKRIKRFHIANVYKPYLGVSHFTGHPKMSKAAVFDIISQDLKWGPIAAGAEIISVANECLSCFPNLANNYEIRISHAKIIELALSHLPPGQRSGVIDILNQSKSSVSQKRALLLKKGLLRSTADELEILSDKDDEIDNLLARLEKVSPAFVGLIQPFVDEVKHTIQYSVSTGVTRQIYFHPLMLGNHLQLFKDGVIVDVVRKNKATDILASGGRYESLITRYSPLKTKADSVCAVGINISVEKITSAIASHQSAFMKTLVKENRSFGFWSPRRCDVYVVSYHAGNLQERLEVVAYLWQHNISADLMYESALPDGEHENYVDVCAREGILFTVYPRPRTGSRREQAAFKVKSILKGTEYELSKQELVGWLQQQIAEQKRIDLSTSGVPISTEGTLSNVPSKDTVPPSSDVQLILPVDTKKQRKHVKQLFLDRAFETGVQLKNSIQTGLPILAVDVPSLVFDAMTRSGSWITDEEAWKMVLNTFPAQNTAYAQQIREAAAKRRTEGHRFLILFAVREERIQLLTL